MACAFSHLITRDLNLDKPSIKVIKIGQILTASDQYESYEMVTLLKKQGSLLRAGDYQTLNC